LIGRNPNAIISALIDLAFGTCRCSGHEPDACGIHEEIPRGCFGQMRHPFRRRRRIKRLK
jgi:hypothetical protein